jgi:hypothetical protein
MTTVPVTTLPPAPQRPRRRALWLVIAVAAAVVVVVPGLWAFGVLVVRHYQDLTSTYWRPVAALRVSVPGGDVTVQAGQPGRVRVEQQVSWEFGRRPTVAESWAGRSLTVTASACRAGKRLKLVLLKCHVAVTIQVPPSVAVRADAAGGSVDLTGLAGTVHAAAAAGAISLWKLSGPVWASAPGGSISAGMLASQQVTAAVGPGSLDLQFVLPPSRVTATATAGEVSVTVPRGSRYRVVSMAMPGNGAVDPGLFSSTSPRLLTVSATSGNVSVGYNDITAPPAHRAHPPSPLHPPQPATAG